MRFYMSKPTVFFGVMISTWLLVRELVLCYNVFNEAAIWIERRVSMPTFEERLTLIEHEHAQLKNENAELKKAIELQTIAIGALVNKAALERLNEKYDKMFDALIAHDRFTNEQLAELRSQQAELDGKIVGMQTEVRQRFEQQGTAMNARFEEVNRKFGHVETELSGHTTVLNEHTTVLNEHTTILKEHTARFDRLETMLAQVLARLPEQP